MVFLKRNRIQLLIASVCLWINIKQMSAPCLFSYNVITSFLFERVDDETVWGGILEMLNNLGFAFYSSLVFYYVVDYFPTRKKERAALRVVADHLSEIVIHIEKLFATLLFVSKKGSKIEDLVENNNLAELCQLELDNEVLRCNWEITELRSGDVYIGCQAETLHPFDDVKNVCEAIKEEINDIYAHVNAEYLAPEIKAWLCDLSENRYIVNISRKDGAVLQNEEIKMIVNCNPYDLMGILRVRRKLLSLPIMQYRFSMWEATEQEIVEVEKNYDDLREAMPKAVEAYEKTMEILQQNNGNKV